MRKAPNLATFVFCSLCSLLLATTVSAKNKSKNKIRFDKYEIETDFKITHPVEAANLAENQKQLVVIGESKDKKRILVIYELQTEGCPVTETKVKEVSRLEIPKSFLAYDIFKNGTLQKILFQTNQELLVFNPNSNEFESFHTVQSIYLRPEAQFLVRKKFVQDLNGDERDDLVIPDFRGVHLFLQTDKGDFETQTLPVAPKIQMNKDSATYNETRFFIADMNLDNKTDFVLAKDKSLLIYPQLEKGKFDNNSQLIKLPIDTSELFWWELRESDGQQVDQNNLAHRIVDKIDDVNNDGLVDLLVRFSQSEGVLDRTNDYEIYLGNNQDGKLTFQEKPQSMITADGTIGTLEIVDIDGDKRSEVLVSSFDIGVSQIIGALLSGSIDQDIYIFQLNEEGLYPEDPIVDKEVEMTFSLSSGKSGEPVVKLADLNGDGLKDLVVSSGESRLKIYPGTRKKRIFEKRSQRIKVDVPKQGSYVAVADINTDGKEDLIVRYGRQDDKELTNKLVLLIAE